MLKCCLSSGTAVGLAPWVVFYAFVGSGGRALLDSGASLATTVATCSSPATGALLPAVLTRAEVFSVLFVAVLLMLRPAAPATQQPRPPPTVHVI